MSMQNRQPHASLFPDISGLRAELRPYRTDELINRALAQAKIGAWACDLSDSRLSWTSGVYDLFGLPFNALPTREQTIRMYTEESRHTLEARRSATIAHGGSFTLDAQIVRTDGAMRWMRITGELLHHVGRPPLLHGLKQDVTDEKRHEEALRRLAEKDALTGLASRAVYESRFLKPECSASRIGPVGALILFDLDGFKGINDRLGHLAGDACLQHVAERLTERFPAALLAARIGGDEFAVIVSDDATAAAIARRVAEFLADLRRPFCWRGHSLTVAATSGIAVPTDRFGYQADALFAEADAMLYAAKRTRASATDRTAPGRAVTRLPALPVRA